MDRYARIENGIVANVIESATDPNQLLVGWTQAPEPEYDDDGNPIELDPPFVPEPIYEQNPQRWVLCGDAGPGWLYDEATGEFSPPPAPPADMRITVLAAINRFAIDEWLDIEEYAMHDPSLPPAERRIRSTVRLFMQKLTLARYVDLVDPAVSEGLDLLVLVGQLTSARADEILTTVPAPHELWASNTSMRAAEVV